MDSDYPLQDELIGIVRLPLSGLELGRSSHQYTCLILHEKHKDGNDGNADASKMNLKISKQANEIYEADLKLKDVTDQLEQMQENYSILRTEKLELEMENFKYSQLEDGGGSEDDEEEFDLSATNPHSAPVSKQSRLDDKKFYLLNKYYLILVRPLAKTEIVIIVVVDNRKRNHLNF